MIRMIRPVLVNCCMVICLFSFLVTGCVQFSNPVVPYSESFLDQSLLGLWNAQGGASDEYFLILWEDEQKEYTIIHFNTPEYVYGAADSDGNMKGIYTGMCDDEKYMIFYFENDGSYFFLNYEIDSDILRVFTLDADILENAIKEQRLEGAVSGKNMNKAISVTESTEGIQAFIKENKNLFDKSSFEEFKRIGLH